MARSRRRGNSTLFQESGRGGLPLKGHSLRPRLCRADLSIRRREATRPALQALASVSFALAALSAVGVAFAARTVENSCPAADGTCRVEQRCGNGTAGAFPCSNVDLLARLESGDRNSGPSASNLWGFVDLNTDRRYALVALRTGLAVVDVTRPTHPFEVAFLKAPILPETGLGVRQTYDPVTGRWRAYAYVAQPGDRLAIVDLGGLPNLRSLTGRAHDLENLGEFRLVNVDPLTGIAWGEGSPRLLAFERDAGPGDRNGVPRNLDLSDPTAPESSAPLASSARSAGGDDRCFAAARTACSPLARVVGERIDLWTSTSPDEPREPVSVLTPNPGPVLSTSITADGRHLFVHDPFDEVERSLDTTFHVLDLAQPFAAATPTARWRGGSPAIDRAGHAVGSRYYLANGTRGLAVLDIAQPSVPVELGFFDVHPDSDAAVMAGASSVYPFLPGGVVLLNNEFGDLFVLGDRTPESRSGSIGFTATSFGGEEGDVVELGVERTGGARGDVSVDYFFVPGSADGGDMGVPAGTLAWRNGESGERAIRVPLASDGVAEDLERGFVVLANPSGGAALARRSRASVYSGDPGTIATIGFSQTRLTVAEGDRRLLLTVERRGSAVGEAAVAWEARDGGALAAESFLTTRDGVLHWPDGDASPRSIVLEARDDRFREFPESFAVHLRPERGALVEPGTAAFARIADEAFAMEREAAPGRVVDESESRTKPNVVIVLADDLGIGDVRAYASGSTLKTPGIDKIAREGMRFSDAHSASPFCAPSRYGLVTGSYLWRTSANSFRYSNPNQDASSFIGPDRPTIATLAKAHGYRTSAIGKWHMGMTLPRNKDWKRTINYGGRIEDGPTTHGFDAFYGVWGSLDTPPYTYIRDDRFAAPANERQWETRFPAFRRQGDRAKDFVFEEVMDRIEEEAEAFIGDAAAGDKPFLLYLALTAPHTPVVPHSRFVGATSLGPYGDFVAQVDSVVASVDGALKEAKVTDDTLLIFASDNGSYMRVLSAGKDHVDDASVEKYRADRHLSNDRWRGAKTDLWEGGHRVPMMVRWPGVVKPGSVAEPTVSLVDLYATIADILGEPPTSTESESEDAAKARDHSAPAEDSVSLLPLLKGGEWRRGVPLVHQTNRGMYALRHGPWKLVLGNGSGGNDAPSGVPFGKPYQLFDLAKDPREERDVAACHPEAARQLEAMFEHVRSTAFKVGASRSGDAGLSSLALDGSELSLDPAVSDYSVYVPDTLASTTVSWKASDSEAIVAVTPCDRDPDTEGHQVELGAGFGAVTVSVSVTAEDGRVEEYTVRIKAPAPVGPLTLVEVDRAGATVSWAAAEGAESYELRYWVATDEAGTMKNVRPSGTSHALKDLEAGTEYVVRVAPVRGGTVDTALASPPLRVTTLAARPLRVALSGRRKSVEENNGEARFEIRLSRALKEGQTVRVPLTITGGRVHAHWNVKFRASENGPGVRRTDTGPRSEVTFTEGGRVAVLVLIARPNTDKENRTIEIAFGTDSRAPSASGVPGGIDLGRRSIAIAIVDDD